MWRTEKKFLHNFYAFKAERHFYRTFWTIYLDCKDMILADDSLTIVSDSESGVAQRELGISASKRLGKKICMSLFGTATNKYVGKHLHISVVSWIAFWQPT